MKIERDEVQYIARGRVIKQTVKSTTRAMVVFGGCILLAIFLASKMPSIIPIAIAGIGAAVACWDMYSVGRKRKELTERMIEEWDKEHKS